MHSSFSYREQSAMSERLCTWDDEDPTKRGQPTPEYLRLYQEWGQGEIGVIVLGSIPCDARYPEAKGNPVMDPKSTWDAVEAFKPVMAASKAKGSLVLGQITHGGRVSIRCCTKSITHGAAANVCCHREGAGFVFGRTVALPRRIVIRQTKATHGGRD